MSRRLIALSVVTLAALVAAGTALLMDGRDQIPLFQDQVIHAKGTGGSHSGKKRDVRGSDKRDTSPPDAAYLSLNSGASLNAAIDAVSNGRPITDPRLASLIVRGQLVCSADLDPSNALSDGASFDPTRAWAVERVVRLCEGFDPSKYQLTVNGIDLVKTRNEHGIEAAATASMDAIKGADDFTQLAQAGQMLLEEGKFPLDQVMPDTSQYGMTEMMPAWIHASSLLACREAGGCGPNSLEVAAYCSSVGCKPGSTLEQALRSRLPASEFQLANAFYNWMLRQRSGQS